MGRDFLVPLSLYCPGTKGQAQNLATGRDGPGQPVKIRDGTRDRTITIFLSKSGTGQRRSCPCPGTKGQPTGRPVPWKP